MLESINERIRFYRKKAKLTQKQVADMLGIKRSTYSNRESSGKIDSDTIIALSKILNVPTSWLLYDSEKLKEPIIISNPDPKKPPKLNQSDLWTDSGAVILTGEEANRIIKMRKLSQSDPKKAEILNSIINEFLDKI